MCAAAYSHHVQHCWIGVVKHTHTNVAKYADIDKLFAFHRFTFYYCSFYHLSPVSFLFLYLSWHSFLQIELVSEHTGCLDFRFRFRGDDFFFIVGRSLAALYTPSFFVTDVRSKQAQFLFIFGHQSHTLYLWKFGVYR